MRKDSGRKSYRWYLDARHGRERLVPEVWLELTVGGGETLESTSHTSHTTPH